MIELEYNGFVGRTCGLRKDGSRFIIWEDNSIEWFSKDEFESILQVSIEASLEDFLSTFSVLADTEEA